MGCGASKGAEVVPPPPLPKNPPPAGAEFTPDSKPRLADQPEEAARSKDSREAAKGADSVVRTGVSQFDDDTDTKQAGPLQAANVPVLPPPPSTPPAAAQKPLFQTGNTTSNYSGRNNGFAAESEDTSYFPTQVALNVGGGFGQQSGPTDTTSLQPFDQPDPPSKPAPVPMFQPAPPYEPAPPLPMFQPAPPSQPSPPVPMFQPAPPTQPAPPVPMFQPQQPMAPLPPARQLQQQPSSAQHTQQTQPEPLRESSPAPLAASLPPPPSGDDPWSSLQSTYRIREAAAKTGQESGRSGSGGSRGPPEAGREVLVLGDDDDFSGSKGMTTNMNRSLGIGGRPPPNLPPPRFGTQPKKGGWGSGAMAQAGELMIGEDDWLESDKPPGEAGGLPPPPPQRQQQQQQQVMSYNSKGRMPEEAPHAPAQLKKPMAKARSTDDVMCEDIEDLDTLLEDELERQGLSSKNLATKFAAYEAKFGSDN